MNRDLDTGIETFQQIVQDGHEIAFHTHPPFSIIDGGLTYYARPNMECTYYDTLNLHQWFGADQGRNMEFAPGVYQFNDPSDVWYGMFTWETTTESLFRICSFLGTPLRHTNGGQVPLLDLTDTYGCGINHPHCLNQTESLIQTGFDLISPEVMPFFNLDYSAGGILWSDTTTYYVSYFGPQANSQIYYPDIDHASIEKKQDVCQGMTFIPVQKQPQVNWEGAGVPDSDYYNAERENSYGGGGIRWTKARSTSLSQKSTSLISLQRWLC